MNQSSTNFRPAPIEAVKASSITSIVKTHAVENSLVEKYSPIAKPTATASLKQTEEEKLATRRKRNPWTKQEDNRLVELIQLHAEDVFVNPNAPIDFIKIARNHDSGRSAKQCRERWKNFLRSGIKKGAWTTDEEELIKDLYATFGAKWSSMAKLFKNRTDSDIKNKWYSMKRKVERNGKTEFKNPFAILPPPADSDMQNSSTTASYNPISYNWDGMHS